MGNGVSLQQFNPAHVRIYTNLLALGPTARVSTLMLLLAGQEYVNAEKYAGIYPSLLNYIMVVESGRGAPMLPGESGGRPQTQAQQQQQPPMSYPNRGTAAIAAGGAVAVADTFRGAVQQQLVSYNTQVAGAQPRTSWQQVAKKPTEKALSFFQSCMEVLHITDEETLDEETLKRHYKRAAIRAHPDKGGSEQQFEAVTRAYAYLNEIIKRVKGKQMNTGGQQTAQDLVQTRASDDDRYKHVQPVALDPKNLNLNVFNEMFEKTRLPDPDEDGYGDWLKEEGGAQGNTFSGKFNRDVFNSMFEKESRSAAGNQIQIVHPQAMALTLAAGMGVELGRDRPADYTAPANADIHYTDLRKAYTTDSTFSGQVAGVKVENRDIKAYRAEREKGPAPLADHERRALADAELEFKMREQARQRRAAESDMAAANHFTRMQQLVLTNGAQNLNATADTDNARYRMLENRR